MKSMPMKPWKKISEISALKNPWWTYKRDECELPSGRHGEYHYVHTNGSSMIIPVMDDGKILMVKQYRYLAAKESIEFPCGSVKDGSTYDETAIHELVEETGYTSSKLFFVRGFNPYNGVTDEMCHAYLARSLQHVGGKPDETEEFVLVPSTVTEVNENIRNGIIWDGMSIAAWQIVTSKVKLD
jgi:ADP-ribose pyrophosphatase